MPAVKTPRAPRAFRPRNQAALPVTNANEYCDLEGPFISPTGEVIPQWFYFSKSHNGEFGMKDRGYKKVVNDGKFLWEYLTAREEGGVPLSPGGRDRHGLFRQ